MGRLSAVCALICLSSLVTGQSSTSNPADGLTNAAGSATASVGTATINGTPTTYSVAFTVPAAADVGPNILPNVADDKAKQAQTLCPGYTASNVVKNGRGFTASLTLAGEPCNAYGTDIEDLTFSLDVQTAHRMRIQIQPAYLDSTNESQYILPEDLVPAPNDGKLSQEVDLQFTWTNDPTFSFTVLRKSTGDVLFDATGSVLVYENQFIEFVTQLPKHYNLYGSFQRVRA